MAAFFTIEIADEERWHLTESCWDKSPFNVLACQEVNISDPIRFRIFQDGKRVDLDSTSFSTLVVSRRFADVVSSIALMMFNVYRQLSTGTTVSGKC